MSDEMRNGHRVFNNCEIIDTLWITLVTGESFGSILVDNGYERKVYCGIGLGHSQEMDENNIILRGGKMYPGTWVPFLSKAWANRITKYCGKCGTELMGQPPTTCPSCNTHVGREGEEDGEEQRTFCD